VIPLILDAFARTVVDQGKNRAIRDQGFE